MKPHAFVAAIVGAVLLPLAAYASPPVVRGAVLFWAADRNGDGGVDRREADELRVVIFDALDTNRDGRVTREEAGAVLVPVKQGDKQKGADKAAEKATKRREALVVKLNLDKPEGIPRDEFIDRNTTRFVGADKNRDGKLDRAEFLVFADGFDVLLPQ